MQKKIAISWVFPAAMILLLHTLVPHSHDFIAHHEHETCEHHQHNFWEFVEHLLHQNCGENHLEYYQISFDDLDFNNDNSLITNDLSHSLSKENSLSIIPSFPSTDFDFKNPFLLKYLTFRGPPFV